MYEDFYLISSELMAKMVGGQQKIIILQSLQQQIFKECHDVHFIGHVGMCKILAATSPAMSFTEMVWRMRSDLQTLHTTRQHTATPHRITEGVGTEVRRHTHTSSSAAGDRDHQPQ